MELKELLHPSLILSHLEAPDAEAVIHRLADLLARDGRVLDGFAAAVLEREKVYPTGLPTEGIGVAIPHTEAEFVTRSSLAVATLRQPVVFQVMGSPAETVEVGIVFLLAIRDKEQQVEALGQLIGVIQDRPLLQRLAAAETAAGIENALAAAGSGG